MMSMSRSRVSRLASRARVAALAALVFTMAAFAASPQETNREQPAVSGDELQNLNRGAPEATSRRQTADGDETQNADPSGQRPASDQRPDSGQLPASGQRPAPSAEQPSSSSPSSPSAVRRPPLTPGSAADRLELDTTVVTGNRELPKVLYIVPWKKAEIGDLPGQPFNTLLDEVLEPVDRDVFRREVTYYDAVTSGSAAAGAAPVGSGDSSEK